MDDLLQEEIDRYRERIPVTHEAAYQSDCDRLRQAGRIFLAVEAGRKGIKPVGFEVSFGFGEEEGLNQADAVKLPLSDRVKLALRGRIDRVDLAGEEYEIWDYKTGSLWGYDERDLLKKGTRLQWALYACVLEEMLSNRGIHVIRSGYFFPGDRGNGRRIGDVPPRREQLGELLEPLLELLPQGCFFHVLREDPCTYCDYGCVCSEEKPLKKLDDLQEIAEDKTEILNSLGRWING